MTDEDLKYLYFGFSYLQDLVERAIIHIHTGWFYNSYFLNLLDDLNVALKSKKATAFVQMKWLKVKKAMALIQMWSLKKKSNGINSNVVLKV